MQNEENNNVQYFLDLIRRSRRGKFKVYIGMIAGVGKTYRMLQEAHELLENGVDVQIGYVETHGRAGTEAQLVGLPVIPRKKIFYKGKELEEMDLEAILQRHPEIVVVDELAHTNVEGCRNRKRWEDVLELLDAGNAQRARLERAHARCDDDDLAEELRALVGGDVKAAVLALLNRRHLFAQVKHRVEGVVLLE